MGSGARRVRVGCANGLDVLDLARMRGCDVDAVNTNTWLDAAGLTRPC